MEVEVKNNSKLPNELEEFSDLEVFKKILKNQEEILAAIRFLIRLLTK